MASAHPIKQNNLKEGVVATHPYLKVEYLADPSAPSDPSVPSDPSDVSDPSDASDP